MAKDSRKIAIVLLWKKTYKLMCIVCVEGWRLARGIATEARLPATGAAPHTSR